jgi:hypothetical protein
MAVPMQVKQMGKTIGQAMVVIARVIMTMIGMLMMMPASLVEQRKLAIAMLVMVMLIWPMFVTIDAVIHRGTP